MIHLNQFIDALDSDGYVLIPDVITRDEITDLKAATDRLIHTDGVLQHPEDLKHSSVVDGEYVPGGPLCRIEYTLAKDNVFVELLGHPCIVGFAAQALREPMLLTWEDMLVKVPFDGIQIPTHQDLLYQSREHLVFSIGVYLDDSKESPMEFMPGTHRFGPLHRAELRALEMNCRERFVPVHARPGDLLIHNVQVIHRSAQNTASTYRRTIYFEFRSLKSVLIDSPWSAEWAWERLPYLAAAVSARNRNRRRTSEDKCRSFTYDRRTIKYWQMNFPEESFASINWRVRHEMTSFDRPCDLEFL